jgi:uncharacterized iron-regulated membrane protein
MALTTDPASATQPRQPSQSIGWHRWLGRILMLYLCVIFATGTLLVFGAELESLLSPQMQRAPVATDSVMASNGALLDAAMMAHPDAKPLIVRAPKSDWFAAEVEMRAVSGIDFIVWLDPHSAAPQGTTAVLGFHELLRRFHVSLFAQSRLVLMLTSAVSVLLIAQLVLGLASYRRFWRGLFRVPGLTQQGRTLWGNWHRWTGLWSLPLLSVISLTGLLYFSETLGFAPDLPAAHTPALRETALPAGFNGATLDKAVAIALTELPGLAVREIYLPVNKTEALRLRGDLDATLVRPRANTVSVDPATMMVLGAHRGQDLGLARRLTEAADPLHYGTWGGLPSQIFWVVSGLFATLLALSGLKIASWRLSLRPGIPSFSNAVRAIFLPGRAVLVGFLIICCVSAFRAFV